MDTRKILAFAVPAAIVFAIIVFGKGIVFPPPPKATKTPTPNVTATRTPTRTVTPTRTATLIPTDTATPGPSETPTETGIPSDTPTPTATSVLGNFTPYPSALSCLNHSVNEFHTLWNPEFGCHYTHEHGQDPYTAAVAAAFPGFDLRALNCGFEVGHCVPSSPMENTMKHGGMKFQVDTSAPQGCAVGFEGGTVAVDAYAVQFHDFGRADIELEARVHSVAALLRQCQLANPADKGYVYTVAHVDYGQRVIPYQGIVAPYPNSPVPSYDSALGPYWSADCVGAVPQCRASLQFIKDRNLNNNSVVTSKSGFRVGATQVLAILWRIRDNYQVFDWPDQVHPFTWRFICGDTVYIPAGCRWNNSTATIHEIQMQIPVAWDNLPGFDTDPRFGRIDADAWLDVHGDINDACSEDGPDCFKIVMRDAFVGFTSSEVSVNKVSNPTPIDTPERDIYFLNGQVVSETTPGAVPSGWILDSN